MITRVIFHIDMDAFFANSEQAIPAVEPGTQKRPSPKAPPAGGVQKKSPGV